ncbi:hypothetical protein K2X33_12125 [bacterium]|nr:hypothetical protein [bacterium]
MISQLLQVKVAKWASLQAQQSPFFVNTRNGSLKPRNLFHYLNNVHYMIAKTPHHLKSAQAEALRRNEPELAAYFASKIHEEVDHDLWAARDVERLVEKFDVRDQRRVSFYVLALENYVFALIKEDPSLYLAYIFLAEYLTVVASPEWLRDLEKACNLPTNFVTVVKNHSELDKEHAAELLHDLDRLAGHCAVEKMLSSLEMAMHLYERFFEEVGKVDEF